MTDVPPDTEPPQPPPAPEGPGADVVKREVWHQLPTETESAFAHFRAYLTQERGRRSLRRLAGERGVGVSTLSDLSALHQWVARVQAHDHHLDAIEEAEFEAEKKRIARAAARAAGSSVEAANLAIRAAILGLQPYIEQGEADEKGIVRNGKGVPVQRLDADQALAAIRAGTRAAVAGHQLVADKVRPGDLPDDEASIEEVAFGLNVWDLARALTELTNGEGPAQVVVEPDVIDVESPG